LFLGDTAPILGEIRRFLREPDVAAAEVDNRQLATVLFTDIASSTEHLASLGDQAWRVVLDNHDSTVDRLVSSYRGTVIKRLGDGMLATFDGPARAVRCATTIREALAASGINLRAGLHTGEIELRDGDVAGLAVHIAGRVADVAAPGEILVSRTVVDLTGGSGITYDPRGDHKLKGIPGKWPIFAAQVPAIVDS
jgi:class 3 adenylate cyclase